MDPRDELDIRNLIARVAWLTDFWSTLDEYLANYTEDATWEIDGHPPYVGHEGVGERVQEALDKGLCGPGLPSRHSVTTLEVVPDTSNSNLALVRSFGVTIDIDGVEPHIKGYGQKHDYVRKEADGVWRIYRRVIGVVGWEGGGSVPYRDVS
jgi:hypothetical protein